MKLNNFLLENWLNPLDPLCKVNLGASCVKALEMDELFEITGEDEEEFFKTLKTMKLGYSNFAGNPRLKNAITKLYRDVDSDMVITTHGGIGANSMILNELVTPDVNVVAIVPNYQQHYDIPKSLGAEVRIVRAKPENGYVVDINDIINAVDKNTKLITLSSPNNPTGVYLNEEQLSEIVEVAKSVDAYILCDEIYRGLEEEYMPSIVDLYDKGICSSSVSKVYSLAGTRVGWLIIRNEELRESIKNRREFDTICGGVIDELIATIGLEHHKVLEKRGRDIINTNRIILNKWLIEHKHFDSVGKSSGTTTLIHYDYDMPALEFCQRVFDETGLLLSHGDCFGEPNSFRLGYSFDGGDILVEGLRLLDEFLDKSGLEK